MNTVGLDDRAWIDIVGFPKSTDARIEERYTRTGPDTIELRMTMHDPKFYTAPWVSDVKTFSRVKREATTYFGWYGLFSGITEGVCAPLNEVDSYNQARQDVGHLRRRKDDDGPAERPQRRQHRRRVLHPGVRVLCE